MFQETEYPFYFFDVIVKVLSTRVTRNHKSVALFKYEFKQEFKHEFCRNVFSPLTVIASNKLDSCIRNIKSVIAFKRRSSNLSDQF